MKIDVTNLQDTLPIHRPTVRRIARAALEGLVGCYSVVFVDDDHIRDINRQYLGRDNVTDVIAFSFDDAPLTRDDCAGEIIISAQRAACEAARRGIAPEAELALYIVHGALHLAGLDDATPEQAAEMHEKEKRILSHLGYDTAGSRSNGRPPRPRRRR